MQPLNASANRASGESTGRPASALKRELVDFAKYSAVALGSYLLFYLLGQLVPQLMATIIPGLPDPISRLGWIVRDFLQVIAPFLLLVAFVYAIVALACAIEAASAAYNLLRRSRGVHLGLEPEE